jgi:hypothetical protein
MCVLYRHQNAEQNHDIKIGNRCFENVAQFRYLGTAITDRNLIEEEIKRRLNSGNACYHSVQSLLSSCLLSKNIKIRIYESVFVLFSKYNYNDQVKADEVSRACSTNGGDEECI